MPWGQNKHGATVASRRGGCSRAMSAGHLAANKIGRPPMTNALRNLFHTSANITTLQPVVSAPAWHADAACMGTLWVCIKVAIVVVETTTLRNSKAPYSFMFAFWSQPHPCESVVVLEIARRCGVWLHSPLLAHCLSVRVRIHALLVCNMAFPTTRWRFTDVSQSFVLCPYTRMCCASSHHAHVHNQRSGCTHDIDNDLFIDALHVLRWPFAPKDTRCGISM